ncbi:unnamed protein product [Protopolystoma xenopodis]|uniref:Uncharacterized protein n=1 Tax=Protopolystoma xenopodis TaxID=117903 RepID=A0A448WUI2_9PLAT|nr:unnamed protein product [Protopolystoma xenopodis]
MPSLAAFLPQATSTPATTTAVEKNLVSLAGVEHRPAGTSDPLPWTIPDASPKTGQTPANDLISFSDWPNVNTLLLTGANQVRSNIGPNSLF